MNNNNSWLTQKQIDHVRRFDPELAPRKPVLLEVRGPQRNYWPLAFWSAWGAGIVLLIVWLVS